MKKLLILLILVTFLVSCQQKVYLKHSTGTVRHHITNKHIHGELWTTPSRTNNHFLNRRLL